MNAPFHAGERQAQALAGAQANGAAIRETMPDQHRDFFASLRFLLVAVTDDDGWPVASIAHGAAGFAHSPTPALLRVDATFAGDDAFVPLLRDGRLAGMLGIDFATRRRNRVNGRISAASPSGFTLRVKESFGNCPKYIVQRRLLDAPGHIPGALERFTGLDEGARALIARSATMFVASSAGEMADLGGVDISHRGGPPGFVRVEGNTLLVPDFSGNRFFNTLGNLLLEPRAALVFIDMDSGDLLHLQGHAEILWQTAGATALPAAERHWRFHVERGWRQPGALPLRWQDL